MKKAIVFVASMALCFSLVAELKIDYVIRLNNKNKSQVVRKLALFNSVPSLLNNAANPLALLSNPTNVLNNGVAVVQTVASNPMVVVGQASALIGNPAGLLDNPTAVLNDPLAIVQDAQDLLVGIDLVDVVEDVVTLVFSIAQKQLNGSLLPLAQIPVAAPLDQLQTVQAVVNNGVEQLESVTISLLASQLPHVG